MTCSHETVNSFGAVQPTFGVICHFEKHIQDANVGGSGMPPLEAPVMIAEKRKLFFFFLQMMVSPSI